MCFQLSGTSTPAMIYSLKFNSIKNPSASHSGPPLSITTLNYLSQCYRLTIMKKSSPLQINCETLIGTADVSLGCCGTTGFEFR